MLKMLFKSESNQKYSAVFIMGHFIHLWSRVERDQLLYVLAQQRNLQHLQPSNTNLRELVLEDNTLHTML